MIRLAHEDLDKTTGSNLGLALSTTLANRDHVANYKM